MHTLLCNQVSMVTSFGVCSISAPWLIIHTKVLLHGISECRYCSLKGFISYTNCKWMLSTQFITYSGTEAGTLWDDSLMVGQGCSSQQSVSIRDFCIQNVLITMFNYLNTPPLPFFVVLVFLSYVVSSVNTKDSCSITNVLITNYNCGVLPVCYPDFCGPFRFWQGNLLFSWVLVEFATVSHVVTIETHAIWVQRTAYYECEGH